MRSSPPPTDHRLWLKRSWSEDDDPPFALHIGMNPSMAGKDVDDLTVRKDQQFTRLMGLSAMVKCNLGTLVSTDPNGLLSPGTVICHPENLATIMGFAERAARIIIATGKPPGPLIPMANNVFRALRGRMECFGHTRDHWPKHSSRLAYATPIVEFIW